MRCKKCSFNGSPNLEETGPHTKATCPNCGAYIKMIGKDELDTIINSSLPPEKLDDLPVTPIDDGGKKEEEELTLVIKTKAPREYMPNVLSRIRLALENDYICGEGIVSKPFDEGNGYEYSFYYN